MSPLAAQAAARVAAASFVPAQTALRVVSRLTTTSLKTARAAGCPARRTHALRHPRGGAREARVQRRAQLRGSAPAQARSGCGTACSLAARAQALPAQRTTHTCHTRVLRCFLDALPLSERVLQALRSSSSPPKLFIIVHTPGASDRLRYAAVPAGAAAQDMRALLLALVDAVHDQTSVAAAWEQAGLTCKERGAPQRPCMKARRRLKGESITSAPRCCVARLSLSPSDSAQQSTARPPRPGRTVASQCRRREACLLRVPHALAATAHRA